jgi:hypothetical protein
VKLSSKQVARLNAARAIALGTPHDQSNGSLPGIAGGKPEVVDLPVIPVA